MLEATLEIGGLSWVTDLSQPVDLSISIDPRGQQPNAFGLPRASEQPFVVGDFVGDTRQGGAVNCFELRLHPHGNGTHTESAGHIAAARQPVGSLLPGLVPGLLVSVEPSPLADSTDHYEGPSATRDMVVTAASLRDALAAAPEGFDRALIVRTHPPDALRTKDWTGQNPPYFSSEAIVLLVAHGVEHLCVDLPSVDREEDDGHTMNHHAFWGVRDTDAGEEVARPQATITELCAVPDDLDDGPVLLGSLPAPLMTDAVPARIVVWPLRR